ncbi:MAG: metallopeptidase family protein [Pseudomonadota bacterium]
MEDSAADLAWFEAEARRTVTRFPAAIAELAAHVALRAEDWPTDEMLTETACADRTLLTGLYEGIPLTEKSVFDQPMAPDTVWLFRQPILLEWRARANISLGTLVAHVTVHEFAHHFGWSDSDIARIDRWWV